MVYEDRPYQTTLIQATEDLLEKNGRAALCVTCAGGKTWMANKIIRNYLDKNPTERVLILAHGRTQLRDQFFADLSEDIDDVAQWLEGECPTSRVVVALPHMRRKNIPKFGMVVFDEAHHYYTASMAQLVLAKAKPDKLLLLTGSAGYFVKTDFPRVMFSAQELRQAQPNVLSDVTTFIVQTTYDFKNDDYTDSNRLKENVKLPII
jgi:superfamily II DNA or RNA helicase